MAPSRFLLSLSLFPLALSGACVPDAARLSGSTDYTVAPAPGVQAGGGAGQVGGVACWSDGSSAGATMTLALGPRCVLHAQWMSEGGRGLRFTGTAVVEGQPLCVVDTAGTAGKGFTLQRGTIHTYPDGVIDATLGGVTEERPPRYLTLHWSGNTVGDPKDGECSALEKVAAE